PGSFNWTDIQVRNDDRGKNLLWPKSDRLATAEAAMDLLNDLKAGGYKIVFMQPKYSVTTIASYDEAILKQLKGPMTDTRPTSSVGRTISEETSNPCYGTNISSNWCRGTARLMHCNKRCPSG